MRKAGTGSHGSTSPPNRRWDAVRALGDDSDRAVELALRASMRGAHHLGALIAVPLVVVIAVSSGLIFEWRIGHVPWSAAMLAAGVAHWIAHRADHRNDRWLRTSALAQLTDGIAWGTLPLFLMPDDPTAQGLILGGILSVFATEIVFAGWLRTSSYPAIASLFVTLSASAALTGTGYIRLTVIPAFIAASFAIAMTNEVHRDRREMVRLTFDLERRANTDPLTGTMNRRAFDQALRDELRLAGEAQVAFLDLDGFKAINDQHGHDVGDELLALVASRLCALDEPVGAVGRIGGDEFTVMATRPGDPDLFGELLLTAFEHPFALGLTTVRLGCSVGIAAQTVDADAVGDRGDDPVSLLLRAADQALLASKRTGGRSVTVGEQLVTPPLG